MEPNTDKHCCLDMAKAHEDETDNEEYGALAHPAFHNEELTEIGSHLPPINFCPWCGDEKGKTK